MTKLPDSGFDRVASFYDPLSRLVFGNSLREAQQALLPFVAPRSRLLLIGGGNGWLLEQLCLTGKTLEVLYLEASPRMLRKAHQRYRALPSNHQVKVEFRLGNEAALKPAEQFDTIITPFLLDLFPPPRLQNLMEQLHARLQQDGNWLFADFWPTAPAPPLWQQILIKSMYRFFGLLSGVQTAALPAYGRHFQQLGLKQVYSRSFYGGLVQAKVYEN